jgi:3',5'-cyclic AMP phosphodiesterase CpdA
VELGTVKRIGILVVADLHVAGPNAKTIRSHGNSDALTALHALVQETQPKMVIVAGDLTDIGAKDQWELVQKSLQGCYELIVVPGNHDYHFRHLAEPGMAQVFQIPASFAPNMIYQQIQKIVPGHNEFPILYQSKLMDVDVLALDSNLRPSRWPLTNGIGMLGPDQVNAAKRLLSNRNAARALIIVLHHHVIPPPFTWGAPFCCV